jgi:hypothetical protein
VERWSSVSSPARQYALAGTCLVVGLVLALGFRGSLQGGGDAVAGFWLGILLLVIGVAALVTAGRQTVVIDSATRRVTVTDATLLRSTTRVITFAEITEVGIGYLGKRSNFVSFYYLDLHLTHGKDYPLFAPGRFFPGSSDRATVEGWRRRLLDAMTP